MTGRAVHVSVENLRAPADQPGVSSAVTRPGSANTADDKKLV